MSAQWGRPLCARCAFLLVRRGLWFAWLAGRVINGVRWLVWPAILVGGAAGWYFAQLLGLSGSIVGGGLAGGLLAVGAVAGWAAVGVLGVVVRTVLTEALALAATVGLVQRAPDGEHGRNGREVNDAQ